MEHQERELLIHRINVCGRTVRFFGIGELIVDVTQEAKPCSIERGSRVLYTFTSLDALEEWCDYQLSQEWAQRIKDPLLRCRYDAVKARTLAVEMKVGFYDLPSRISLRRLPS